MGSGTRDTRRHFAFNTAAILGILSILFSIWSWLTVPHPMSVKIWVRNVVIVTAASTVHLLVRSLAIYLVMVTDQTVTSHFLIYLGSSDSPTQSRLAKGPRYA